MKGMLVVGIPFALQILLLIILWILQLKAEDAAFKVERGLHLSQTLSSLLQDFVDIRVNAARFRTHYLISEQFYETRRHAMDQLSDLKTALKEEPENVKIIENVENHAREAIKLVSSENQSDDTKHLDALDNIAKQIQSDTLMLSNLIEEKEAIVEMLTRELKAQGVMYQFTLYAGSLLQIVILITAILLFGKDVTNRIKIIQENSLLLAMRKPLARRLHGSDELARLDEVFHKMAEELEESLQIDAALTENVMAVFCKLDAKLVFNTSNSSSVVVFGYTPGELAGLRLANVLPQAELHVVADRFEKSRSQTLPPFETPVVKKDGTLIDTLWSIRWSKDDNSYVCAIHNNSVHKEGERMRERLLGMVTDDLKRPLSSVSAFLTSLRQNDYGELAGRGNDLANTATGATLQMLTLINDLLDMEQLESGTLRVHCQQLALEPVFAQALQAASAISKRGGVQLEAHANGLHVLADPNRMMQILTNLISNAVKFSPKGSIVSLNAVAAEDCVEVKVIDKGRGIPPDAVPHIFDRFRQTERADATEKKGVGLGLAITKALVELQNGTISVESTFGEGTTFAIRLPATRAATPEQMPC